MSSDNPVDLGALQAQLELSRSVLADSIMSKLPAFATSSPTQAAPTTARPAGLGVGAKPTTTTTGTANGRQDLRLLGKLNAKRKREQDLPAPNQKEDDDQDENEPEGKGKVRTKKKSHDPFQTKPGAVTRPAVVELDGKTVDLSTLSKAQRKKINRKVRQEAEGKQAAAAPVSNKMPEAESPKAKKTSKPASDSASESASASAPNTETSALTPLQAQMLSKLSGSRFRTINEKLYTSSSSTALDMVQADPTIFDEYHKGFREQVKGWPKNPVDRIAEMLDPSAAKHSVSSVTGQKRARYRPGALVVDLGAGEAGLARKLVPRGVRVLSYDLVDTPDGWVRGLDAARIGALPLPGHYDPTDPLAPAQVPPKKGPAKGNAPGIVDVAVFCLSLMGTNWVQMVLEARRVLSVG